MSQDTPILLIGYGSIGKRRYEALRNLGYTNVAVHDVIAPPLPAPYFLPELTDEALTRFRAVVIASPTTLHVAQAERALKAGCAVFIEKPLAQSSDAAQVLLTTVEEKVAAVAANFRFHDGFRRLETILESEAFGAPTSAEVHFTRDITRGGHDQSYATSYAAQKEGGGVLFDLGPHVVEYLEYLFGEVTAVVATLDKRTDLSIANEDTAQGTLSHREGMTSTFLLDYYTVPKRHDLRVVCERGTLFLDMANGTLVTTDAGGYESHESFYTTLSADAARTAMYEAELARFLGDVERKTPTAYPLSRAVQVLRILERLRDSQGALTRVTL